VVQRLPAGCTDGLSDDVVAAGVRRGVGLAMVVEGGGVVVAALVPGVVGGVLAGALLLALDGCWSPPAFWVALPQPARASTATAQPSNLVVRIPASER
jgi:hypothetical protein